MPSHQPDSEGLIFNDAAYSNLEVVSSSLPQASTVHPQPGLIPVPSKVPMKESHSSEKLPVYSAGDFNGGEPLTVHDPAIDAAKRKKKRILLLIGAIALIAIIIAAVVGGVLGSKAAHKDAADTSASSTQGSSSSPHSDPSSSSGRVRSTSGVWNGTAVGLINSGEGYSSQPTHWGSIFYQDYTGALMFQPFDWPDSSKPLSPANTSPQAVMIEDPSGSGQMKRPSVANGTGIGTSWYRYEAQNVSYYFITYVAPDGTLSDMYTNQSRVWGPWTVGNLSSKGWKAPTDNRPAMLLDQSWAVYGKSFGNGGFRLTAGGTDGKLHQYSYDIPTGEWADEDVVLADSYAYAGVARATSQDSSGYWTNSTVYTMDKDGQLIYYTQDLHNTTNWASSPPFRRVTSGQNGAVNSSLAVVTSFNQGNAYAYFPDKSSGKMAALSISGNPSGPNGQFVGSVQGVGPSAGVTAMAGTGSITWAASNPGWMVYQDEGNSLAISYLPNVLGANNHTFLSATS